MHCACCALTRAAPQLPGLALCAAALAAFGTIALLLLTAPKGGVGRLAFSDAFAAPQLSACLVLAPKSGVTAVHLAQAAAVSGEIPSPRPRRRIKTALSAAMPAPPRLNAAL